MRSGTNAKGDGKEFRQAWGRTKQRVLGCQIEPGSHRKLRDGISKLISQKDRECSRSFFIRDIDIKGEILSLIQDPG